MNADQPPKDAGTSQPKPEDKRPATQVVGALTTPGERALVDMVRNAKTLEEKGIAAFSLLYDRVIVKIAERQEGTRMDDVELEKLRMRNDMIKWAVQRVSVALLIALVVTGIVVAWKAGDKELAKDILKFLFGSAVGFGVKASVSSATSKD